MTLRNNLGVALHTLRELDVSAVRAEIDHALNIACLGAYPLYAQAVTLLRSHEGHR